MKRLLALGLLFLSFIASANAQSTGTVVLSCGSLPIAYSKGASRPITVDVNGQTCISGTINATSAVKSTAAAPTYVEGSTNPVSSDLSGNQRVIDSSVLAAIQSAQPAGTNLIGNTGLVLPAGSTPIQATATGTTAATTATMAADATQFNFVCGFSIRANATAASTGDATLTGLATSPLHFTQWTAPLASGLGVTEQIMVPCQPSSAINTGISVVSAAPGSGGTVSVTVWGFKKVASP